LETRETLLEEELDESSRAVFGAMRAAYKTGLLDEFLSLAGTLMGSDADTVELMGNAEETLTETDLAPIAAALSEVLLPLAGALSGERAAEAARYLLSNLRPAVEKAVSESGGDPALLQEKARQTADSLRALVPVARAVAPDLLRAAALSLDPRLGEKAGRAVGALVSANLSIINTVNDSDPEIISRFAAGVAQAVDPAEARRAAAVLMRVLFEHRPRPLRFLARTVSRRSGKRLGR
jgi:hypothetical protein